MGHLLSIIFFFGLLVALAALLEQIVRTHRAAIVDALRGPSAAPAARAGSAAGSARRLPGVHAAA